MLDALLWLMGNPELKSVTATSGIHYANEIGSLKDSGALTGEVHSQSEFKPEEMNVEDFSSGSMLFENGARVNFTVAWAANMPDKSDIRIIGQNKGIYIPECKLYSGAGKTEDLKPVENLYPDSVFPGHIYLMDNLRKVLKGEEKPVVTPEETINVSRIIEAVYKSANTGKEVIL